MSSRSHHRRHYKNFPPQEYTDLTDADIALLVPIFTPPPQAHTSAYAAHESTTRAAIAALPAHLRCKLPLVSTFCHLHRNVNPMPVDSMLRALQEGRGPARCAACELALLASCGSGLMGPVLGSVRRRNWVKSRRVRWLVEWFGEEEVWGKPERPERAETQGRGEGWRPASSVYSRDPAADKEFVRSPSSVLEDEIIDLYRNL